MPITDILSGGSSLARILPQASRAVDVVAITGAGFAPIFQRARPLTASVYEVAQLMEHPLENGSVIADHIVHDPIEIDLPVVCVGEAEYRSTYQSIKTAYIAGTILTVTTRTGSYPNMVLLEIPHEESPEAFDAIRMDIRLREARFVQPQSQALSQGQVANANQSSTLARGSQQTTGANASLSGAAAGSYANSGSGAPATGSTLYRWAYE
jgi:hypothetical protein